MDADFSGSKLWADDFDPEQVEKWFADEAEASFDLGEAKFRDEYRWRGQQDLHCFSRLPKRSWSHVMGFGSAFGEELRPLSADQVTIVESSTRFHPAPDLPFLVAYVQARPLAIDLPDASADLIVCFGVLHHVANVTAMLSEFWRVLEPDGYAVIVEPSVSMGDWRRPRPHLTVHERGIPFQWMTDALEGVGFQVVRATPCDSSVVNVIGRRMKRSPYNVRWVMHLDAVVCRLLQPVSRYHATSRAQRVRATSGAYVVRKPPVPTSSVGTRPNDASG